ncbi:putative nuclease HARBI1 [Heptranchias perlo]|uniref:putative nuclease HARBI1 n=1 Tax=Heptranchias perlo TaxID=212740 RepID=UPI0035598DA3
MAVPPRASLLASMGFLMGIPHLRSLEEEEEQQRRSYTESNIPALFHTQNRLKGWLLGDKRFPLQTWLMTPLRNPINEAQQQYSDSHTTTRSVIEQAIGLLKMRFQYPD